MKNLILLLSGGLCLLLSNQLPAQKNWRPGAITTESGSVLQGEVNYRNWDINPTQVQFQQASGETLTYSKEEIERFEVIREDGVAEL